MKNVKNLYFFLIFRFYPESSHFNKPFDAFQIIFSSFILICSLNQILYHSRLKSIRNKIQRKREKRSNTQITKESLFLTQVESHQALICFHLFLILFSQRKRLSCEKKRNIIEMNIIEWQCNWGCSHRYLHESDVKENKYYLNAYDMVSISIHIVILKLTWLIQINELTSLIIRASRKSDVTDIKSRAFTRREII